MASAETFRCEMMGSLLILCISFTVMIFVCCGCSGEKFSFFNFSFPVCFSDRKDFLLALTVKLKQLYLGMALHMECLLFQRGLKFERIVEIFAGKFFLISREFHIKSKERKIAFKNIPENKMTFYSQEVSTAVISIFITIYFSSCGLNFKGNSRERYVTIRKIKPQLIYKALGFFK